jgi:hypothetical protein
MTEKFKEYIEHAKMIYMAQPNAWTSAAYRAALRLESLYADSEREAEEAKILMDAAKHTYDFAQAEKAKYTWQPIETAPYDEPVLISWVNRVGNHVVGQAWRNFEEVETYSDLAEDFKVTRTVSVWSFDYDGKDVLHYAPTHWMHLPEPPEAPATEEENNDE